MLTICTNLLYGTSLSRHGDLLQVFPPRRDRRHAAAQSRASRSSRRLTAKILKRGYTIFEVPISYNGRDFHEGKKITWRDGFTAVRTLVKYRFVD